MGNKTIYIQDDALWKKAKKLAGKLGLSGVIAKALEDFVNRSERQQRGYERLQFVVPADDDVALSESIGFEGKRVFSDQFYLDELGPPERIDIYLTRAGNLVLISRPEYLNLTEERAQEFGQYKSLRALSQSPLVAQLHPSDRARLLATLSSELKDDFVTWID